MPLIQGRSKKSFKKNVDMEMDSGKPQKQSLAIAFNVQRKNKKKMAKGGPVSAQDEKESNIDSESVSQPQPRHEAHSQSGGQWTDSPANHMASGSKPSMEKEGAPNDLRDESHETSLGALTPEEMNMIRDHREKGMGMQVPNQESDHFADGGEVEEIEHNRPQSVAKGIMRRKKVKMMANGGLVDNDHSDDSMADLSRNADEDPNNLDDLNYDALRKENYSEQDGLDQLDQPMDSNEHGHEIDSDKHDMIESIRKKIKAKHSR